MVRERQGEGADEVQGEELCVCFYVCLRECVLFFYMGPCAAITCQWSRLGADASAVLSKLQLSTDCLSQ